jgi:hypothetical protein
MSLFSGGKVMDFKVLVEAIDKGVPLAILIAAIGAIWQLIYAYTRDKLNYKEAALKRELETAKFEYQKALEAQKFEHQSKIEQLKFEYDQRKWKEQLALQLAHRHVDARLVEYPPLWSIVRAVAKHKATSGDLTSELTWQIAGEVEAWRYSKGGLLAEETTRDAALAFQTALWHYDGSKEAYSRILYARRLLRASLRADMGLGVDALGKSIFDTTEDRQKIIKELADFKAELGMISISKAE